jgi:hypothetical protein
MATAPGDFIAPALAMVGAVFGGVGVKYVDRVFSVKDKRQGLAQELHAELRAENRELKTAVRELERQADVLQGQYYKLMIKYNMVRGAAGLGSDLDDPVLEARIAALAAEVNASRMKEKEKPDTPAAAVK